MSMQNPWTIGEINIAVEMAKEGKSARAISEALTGRTRNSVIGLLHRRKIQMSIFKSKPYPTKPPKVERKKTVTLPTEPPPKVFIPKIKDEVIYGRVKLLDADKSQCRFIEGKDLTFVCGDPVHLGSSWCECHYKRVFTPESVAKAVSVEIKRLKLMNQWKDRQSF